MTVWKLDPTTQLAGDKATSGGYVVKRVGHRGAGSIQPGNTLASFDAALDAGVDMIEFDVIKQRRSGRLLVAHDRHESRREGTVTLDVALGYLSSDRFFGIELVVDLKLPGYEGEVVAALQRHGLIDRVLICSQLPWSLARVRRLQPRIKLGWSILGVGQIPERGRLGAVRRSLIARTAAAVSSGRCNTIMAHWRTATPDLVAAVRAAGGDVYAWTVDEVARIEQLAQDGVAGIISNDPRLFSGLRAAG